jgi:hypothetical protein
MKGSSILAGLILIAVGVIFLLMPLFPNVFDVLNISQQWPLIIVLIGGMFILGALLGSPGLAVPGSIVGGIGLLLYYQNATNSWETWAYAWALIPVFIGIGVILSNAISGNLRAGIKQGGQLIIIGLILFLVFGSFLGAGFGSSFGLAILLIGAGLWMIVRIFTKGKEDEPVKQDLE